MRTKFKAWAEPYIKEHSEVCLTLDAIKDVNHPFYLEIGAGKGQFIVEMAKKFPNLFFIGVERNVTCSGFIAKKLVEQEITNAKLVFDNANKLIDYLKEESIEGIFLNFSDPWPKKRHWKRRLTAPQFLSAYYKLLVKGGKIYIKTDNQELFNFTREMVISTDFKVLVDTENYATLDDFDTMTEYEESFREEGQPIYRMILEK